MWLISHFVKNGILFVNDSVSIIELFVEIERKETSFGTLFHLSDFIFSYLIFNENVNLRFKKFKLVIFIGINPLIR